MEKEYTIYSKWLALALRGQGFRLIRTGINQNFPQYMYLRTAKIYTLLLDI